MSPALSPTPPAAAVITRTRASAMAPERRRNAIVAATLPLLAEYGASVTTSQIARAAGVAEGTIFRVFPDKQALLLAALHVAMSADAEVARIAAISAETPLAERLLAAIAAMSDYQDRLWRLMRVVQELGWRPDRDATTLDTTAHDANSPRQQMQRVSTALAALFQPDADSIRLEPITAARLLVALTFTCRMQEYGMGEPVATAAQIVDLFLHGALRQDAAHPPCITSGGSVHA